jgi:hypothetical protein
MKWPASGIWAAWIAEMIQDKRPRWGVIIIVRL